MEKTSAVLDYPREISSPLNADHQSVCKFDGPRDANYIAVRNILKLVTSKATPESSSEFSSLDDQN